MHSLITVVIERKLYILGRDDGDEIVKYLVIKVIKSEVMTTRLTHSQERTHTKFEFA